MKSITVWLSPLLNKSAREDTVKYFSRMYRKLAHSTNTCFTVSGIPQDWQVDWEGGDGSAQHGQSLISMVALLLLLWLLLLVAYASSCHKVCLASVNVLPGNIKRVYKGSGSVPKIFQLCLYSAMAVKPVF